MAQTIERLCKTCSSPITGQGRRSYCQDSCNPRNQGLRCLGCGEPVFGRGKRYCPRIECRPQCSEVGCDEAVSAKSLCVIHYHRKLNSETSRPPRQCETCGADFPSRRGGPRWCSVECRPRCIEEGCDRPRRTAGRCGTHYAIGGSRTCLTCSKPVSERRKYCSSECYPRCVVKWCTDRGRTFGLCHRHDAQRRSSGVLRTEFSCDMCGGDVPPLTPDGRPITANTRLCSPCRDSYRAGSKTSVAFLVQRDGRDCSLCLAPIDLALRWPNPGSASIDHVLPKSRGGSDDLPNLALTHLGCNCSKGNRIP